MKQYSIPKKFKYKKNQKQIYRFNGIAEANYMKNYHCFLVKMLVGKRIRFKQFEAFRRVVKRFLKKEGKLYHHSICDLSITEKSVGIRMGKGKGSVKEYVASIKRGNILYSLCNINLLAGNQALGKAAKKLGSKVMIKSHYVSSIIRLVKNVND